MKKIITTILLLVAIVSYSFAESVDIKTAQKVATTYLQNSSVSLGSVSLDLAFIYKTISASNFNSKEADTTPLIYIFNIGKDEGFILISGDDVASPVLGYVLSGSFDYEKIPDNFSKWIEGYKSQISYAIYNKLEANDHIKETWISLIAGSIENTTDNTKNVAPMCTTTWSQSPYYNAQCPGGSVTGCVATAMAQVMKYWNHPAQGSGMHSYNHQTYGTLSANFGSTTYQWSQMPNSINSSNSAIATLMYHCGVSVDMNYSPNESGAWVVEDDSPVCAESAFKNYFGYSNTLHGEKRENYSTSQWTNMLKGDLDAGRPLVYAGFGSGGGHAFVCDGYNDGDYFHFNWGWSGLYNGFFHIDALDPQGTGTGGGTGGYNSGHQAIFGMTPETTTSTYDLRLYDNIVASPATISLGQAFTVQTKVGNFGDNAFNGQFSAYIFDNNMNVIDNVEIINGALPAQEYNTYTFSTSGLSSLLPGSYTISVFYKPSGGNWIKVGNGSYTNSIPFTVSNESDIELYSDLNVIGGTTITIGDPLSVIVDIANYGSTTYYGSFDVSLYNLEGYFVETIETLSGAALESMSYYDDLEFSTAGVNIEPGSYLIALQHKPDGGSWHLSGSTDYPNPIQVIVREAGVAADVYEPNDDESSAVDLAVNFSGNNASVYTTGSNTHVGNDYDYYNVYLPTGYNYEITARAHDSYNSGNGQTYTNDIVWAFKSGTFWSSAYDDVMLGSISVSNGGNVKFLTAPYFLGETGTYLLDIQITRTPLGVEDIDVSEKLKLYPVPVSTKLKLELADNSNVNRIQIIDVMGITVIDDTKPIEHDGNYTVQVSNLNSGTYIVVVSVNDSKIYSKFIKK